MALIIYPLTDWSSFITEAEADGFMQGQLNNAAWLAMTTPQKDSLLVQTAMQIRLCPSINLPATNEQDLKLGQMYLLLHASNVDMVSFDANDRAITNETVDVLSVSYDANLKGSNADFPSMARSLLSGYGCSGSNGAFVQIPLGRN